MNALDEPLISVYSIPPKIQNFSLPKNIIFYISKNPSTAKVYNKLIKICKYFYLKNPIITFENLELFQSSNSCEVTKVCGIYKSNEETKFKIHTLPKKIWVHSFLTVDAKLIHPDRYLASFVLSKIYRCDIVKLELFNQNLTYEEFKLLSSTNLLKFINFFHSYIFENDGSNSVIVPIEKIIEICPNLEEFHFYEGDREDWYYSIKSQTAKNLIEIPHFPKLTLFDLSNVPETFEFETFFNNLKKPWKMEITLEFNSLISDNYKERLQTFVDNLIAAGITENFPPKIRFYGMTNESYTNLRELQNDYDKKYKKFLNK